MRCSLLVIYVCLRKLFCRSSHESWHCCCISLQCEYQILVQLLEIYNEQLRDLLDETRTHKRLDIRNTERSGLNVPDAIQVQDWQLGCVTSR